ncbi:MAG: purple acid phosphatase family protein [Gammaproteobacteria bacterium]
MNRRAWLTVLLLVSLPAPVAAAAEAMDSARSDAQRLQFIVIGDWGMRGSRHQRQVATQMERLAASTPVDFIVSTGDNFYPKGVNSTDDPKWQSNFENVYALPHLKAIPWYVVLGNHDYLGDFRAEIDYGRHHANWILKHNYYEAEFNLGRDATVQLLFLDTNSFIKKYRNRPDIYHHIESQDTVAQLAWLEKKLTESRHLWRLAFGHHPVFSSGRHGDTDDLKAVLPGLFSRYGVNAYFAGHDHHLEHIKADGPTHYFISGGGGAWTRAVKRSAHSRFSQRSLGFAHVLLDRRCLRVRFINADGEELYRTAIPARAVIECE